MNDCLFCKIIAGEIPSTKVYEDEKTLAFRDINPKASVHVLIIPKEHIRSAKEISEENKELFADLILVAKKVAESEGLKGYKLLFNTEKEGGQEVFHAHLHLLGGDKINVDKI